MNNNRKTVVRGKSEVAFKPRRSRANDYQRTDLGAKPKSGFSRSFNHQSSTLGISSRVPVRRASVISEETWPMRLSKRMGLLGMASRREADEWIAKGWVRVNGVVAELGQKVGPQDQITLNKAAQEDQAERVTIVLHKPVGYVSGQAEDGYEPAKVLVRAESRWNKDTSPRKFHPSQLRSLVPAGRLDIDSVGLLILTQDGRVAKHIIDAQSTVDKEYIVRVANADGTVPPNLSDDKLARLRFGLSLDGVALQRAEVEKLNESELRFILREGKKRQIRRMCALVGLTVTRLKRVRIGQIRLGALPMGQWRYLSENESI